MILNFCKNLSQSNAPVIQFLYSDKTSLVCSCYFSCQWLMGKSFKKIYSFTGLLVTLIIISCSSGWSQQSPEPPAGIMAGQPAGPGGADERGLLFRLSGRYGFNANYAAGGQTLPNYLRNVQITEDGPYWHAVEADDFPLLSYWAPGNIYAQRGTLSFFWRSHHPAGSKRFPVFHAGFSDNSGEDRVWLNIDYNGSGFDVYLADAGLSPALLSHYMDEPPGPDEWVHLAISWDETEGIHFYINGILVGKKFIPGLIYDTGLDQFGPYSGITNPYHLQNRYGSGRGGDVADLRIYDRMLSDENVFTLARGERIFGLSDFRRNLINRRWRDAWWKRHGWNLPNEAPPVLASSGTSVRKVEINNATDTGRWYWKATDGIRETTWPGPCNMLELPGRYDHFAMPDGYCYSWSGQAIPFNVQGTESWNHIEIWGKARGQLTHENEHPFHHTFDERDNNQVKSYHRLEEAKKGGVIRFDNTVSAGSIGSFMVYDVKEGIAPADRHKETFTLVPAPVSGSLGLRAMDEVAGFIYGRYPADERTMMTGVAEDETPPEETVIYNPYAMPVIHIIIPYSDLQDKGLDGIEIELPEMNVKPTHKEVFPLNLRIKDPLWQMRDLADFSFSIEPGKKYRLWIDTRDRILPRGRALYLTLAGAGQDLTPEILKGAKVSLVYKSKDEALAEHIKDRFNQVRDLHAHNVEKNIHSPRVNTYNRFYADLQDILIHDPGNWLAKTYWYYISGDKSDRPEYEINKAPEGIPGWAHLQVEYLRHLERVVMYNINDWQGGNIDFSGRPADNTSPFKQKKLPLLNRISTIKTDEPHTFIRDVKVISNPRPIEHSMPARFNPDELITFYTEEIKELGVHEYINTKGGILTDHILLGQDIIQKHRSGAIPMIETENRYARNFASWEIHKPGSYESLAIFITKANENSINIVTYNLEKGAVHASMTPGHIIPGRWRVIQGTDTNGNQEIDSHYSEKIIELKSGEKLGLTFMPRQHTIIQMELIEPHPIEYQRRADLGIGKNDIKIDGNGVVVRIHSLGEADVPETTAELRDSEGNIVVTKKIPSLEAPLDLVPSWTEIRMEVPEGTDISRGSVIIDPHQMIPQISRTNTIVKW